MITAFEFWVQASDAFIIMDKTQAVLVASNVKWCNTESVIGNVNIKNVTRSSFAIYFL